MKNLKNEKLTLKKATVVNFNAEEMTKVRGGVRTKDVTCVLACQTDPNLTIC